MEESTKELDIQTGEVGRNIETAQVIREVRLNTGEKAQIPLSIDSDSQEETRRETYNLKRNNPPARGKQEMVPLTFVKEPEKGTVLTASLPGEEQEFNYQVTDAMSKDYLKRWPDAVYVKRLNPTEYKELKKEGTNEKPLRDYLPADTVQKLGLNPSSAKAA